MAKRNELTAPMAIALDAMWQAQHDSGGHREVRSAKAWGMRKRTARALVRRGAARCHRVWPHPDYYEITDKGVNWGKS